MFDKAKTIIKAILANDSVRRVLHTFWQTASGVLVAQLVVAQSSADVKLAVAAAIAAGLSAAKAAVVVRVRG